MHENKQEQNQNQLDQNVNAPSANVSAEMPTQEAKKESPKRKMNPKKLIKPLAILAIVVLLVGGISMLAYKNVSLLVVGKIGNSFITRKELNDKLFQTYGQSLLDQLVEEKIIAQAIAKSGVTYSQEEFDAKIAEVSTQIQQGTGMSLDEYLASQNMPRKDLEKNIAMQLSLEKLLTPKIEVADEEIDTFIEENGQYLTGETDEAKREEAVDALLNQKLGEAFQTWLEEQKAEVKVSTFIE